MKIKIITITKNTYNSLLHCGVQDDFAITSYPWKTGIWQVSDQTDELSSRTHIWFSPRLRPQALDVRHRHMVICISHFFALGSRRNTWHFSCWILLICSIIYREKHGCHCGTPMSKSFTNCNISLAHFPMFK